MSDLKREQTVTMAQSFRQIIGVPPSTASTKDSVLLIIDAQNEYVSFIPLYHHLYPPSHFFLTGHMTNSTRYIEGKLKTENIASTRLAISSLLEKYRAAGGDVIHIVHQVPAGAPVFTPDTNLAKEFEELTPKNGEVVVTKNYPGSFASTDLEEEIKKTGKNKLGMLLPSLNPPIPFIPPSPDPRNTLSPVIFRHTAAGKVERPHELTAKVLTGYMAHICVSTTARQAAQRGYDVLVAGDAVGDRDIPGVKGEELTRVVLAELADGFATVVQSGEVN